MRKEDDPPTWLLIVWDNGTFLKCLRYPDKVLNTEVVEEIPKSVYIHKYTEKLCLFKICRLFPPFYFAESQPYQITAAILKVNVSLQVCLIMTNVFY